MPAVGRAMSTGALGLCFSRRSPMLSFRAPAACRIHSRHSKAAVVARARNLHSKDSVAYPLLCWKRCVRQVGKAEASLSWLTAPVPIANGWRRESLSQNVGNELDEATGLVVIDDSKTPPAHTDAQPADEYEPQRPSESYKENSVGSPQRPIRKPQQNNSAREARHRTLSLGRQSHLTGNERQALTRFSTRPVDEVLDDYKTILTSYEMYNLFMELQRCHDWKRTLEMFNWLKKQDFYKPSLKLYNSLLGFFGREGHPDVVEELFLEMFNKPDTRPNHYSYTALIVAYGRAKMYTTAHEVFEHMKITREPECRPNIVTCNALIGIYLKAGLYSRAVQVLEDMRYARNGLTADIKPNLITYNTIVAALCQDGQIQAAIELVEDMHDGRLEVMPSTVTYNTLIDACGKVGLPNRAEQLYARMKEKGLVPDQVTCTALMDAFDRADMTEKVHAMFKEMKAAGLKTDVVAYTVLVVAYGRDGDVAAAEQVYREMLAENVRPTAVTYLALIDTYGKSQQPERAEAVFEEMRRNGVSRSVHTYSSLIDAYGRAGDYQKAVGAFRRMQQDGVQPNLITHAALLNTIYWSQSRDSTNAILPLLKGVSNMGTVGTMAQMLMTASTAAAAEGGAAAAAASSSAPAPPLASAVEQLLAALRPEPPQWRQSFINALADVLLGFGLEARAALLISRAHEHKLYSRAGCCVYEKECWEIDLHDLSVGAAIITIMLWLQDLHGAWLWDEAAPAKIRVVTGWGRHARRGESRVKVAVEQRLRGMGSPLFEAPDNPGCMVAAGSHVRAWLLDSRTEAFLTLSDRPRQGTARTNTPSR